MRGWVQLFWRAFRLLRRTRVRLHLPPQQNLAALLTRDRRVVERRAHRRRAPLRNRVDRWIQQLTQHICQVRCRLDCWLRNIIRLMQVLCALRLGPIWSQWLLNSPQRAHRLLTNIDSAQSKRLVNIVRVILRDLQRRRLRVRLRQGSFSRRCVGPDIQARVSRVHLVLAETCQVRLSIQLEVDMCSFAFLEPNLPPLLHHRSVRRSILSHIAPLNRRHGSPLPRLLF